LADVDDKRAQHRADSDAAYRIAIPFIKIRRIRNLG
jgi:hypothetical protein